MSDFTTSLILKAEEDKVYDSLTRNISDWWTEIFEGSAEEVSQVFTIRFGPQVFKTMRVEELVRNEQIIWRVEDALIDLPDLVNNKEWINTRIRWNISSAPEGTSLRLTHQGLRPEVECYELCTSGWQSFLYSFNKFVTTGTGTPFRLVDID
ncbi:MAG: SRPBCC family protein [Arcticibacter sp.]